MRLLVFKCATKVMNQAGVFIYMVSIPSFLSLQMAERMSQEATRLLRNDHRDIPVNIEPVKEPAHIAVGTGCGLW